ncbi:MAG: sulfotransferase [Gemmatimonadota bacterium]
MKHVFVVGAPRSGTTWVQLLLAQHPDVATSQETHLFERYLMHLERTWLREKTVQTGRAIGLRPLLSDQEFYALCRAFAAEVLRKAAGNRTSARYVVEKTPGHVLSGEFILKLLPEAHIIHVVRDPRAAASSLRRAGRTWGRRWAPSGVIEAARVWLAHVEAGCALAAWTDRYTEIRYEELHRHGERVLHDLFCELGLEAGAEFCREALEACDIERLRRRDSLPESPWSLSREPEGFYGPGRAEGWREELKRREVRLIEYIGRPAMTRLGYAPVTGQRRKPLRLIARDTLERLGAGLDWRLRRALTRL